MGKTIMNLTKEQEKLIPVKPEPYDVCVCGRLGRQHIAVDLREVAGEVIHVCPKNRSGLAPLVFKKQKKEEKK